MKKKDSELLQHAISVLYELRTILGDDCKNGVILKDLINSVLEPVTKQK